MQGFGATSRGQLQAHSSERQVLHIAMFGNDDPEKGSNCLFSRRSWCCWPPASSALPSPAPSHPCTVSNAGSLPFILFSESIWFVLLVFSEQFDCDIFIIVSRISKWRIWRYSKKNLVPYVSWISWIITTNSYLNKQFNNKQASCFFRNKGCQLCVLFDQM